MKRNFLLIAFVMLLSMSFVACEPYENENENGIENGGNGGEGEGEGENGKEDEETPAPEPPALTFDIALEDIGVNSVTMSVTPSDNEAVYLYDILQVEILEQHHGGSVKTYVQNLVASALEEMDLEAVYYRIGTKGADSYTYQSLAPDTEYIAFAVAINVNCEAIGEVASELFSTQPLPTTFSWDVTFDEIFYGGISFTITPSDESVPYYFTVRPYVSHGRVMNDEKLLETIIAEDYMMIPFWATKGVYTSTYDVNADSNDFILCSDTGYELLIFAFADGEPLSEIQRFPFRTLKPDVESFSFDITVTPGVNNAEVVVAPSDKHTMYLWDVVSKNNIVSNYNGDMAKFVKAYIDNMIGTQGLYELDFSRIMGDDSYNFPMSFEPSTDYIVWAVQVDEYGKVVGDIALKPFKTLAEDTPAEATQKSHAASSVKSRKVAIRQ